MRKRDTSNATFACLVTAAVTLIFAVHASIQRFSRRAGNVTDLGQQTPLMTSSGTTTVNPIRDWSNLSKI